MSEEIIEFEEKEKNAFVSFLINVWDKIKYFLSQAEPYIISAIHVFISETVRLIKIFFKYALEQIKSES